MGYKTTISLQPLLPILHCHPLIHHAVSLNTDSPSFYLDPKICFISKKLLPKAT
ncbi:hypothetical protein KsCSTR_03380 [Candidatus Kuenenia stuttgartiensis]|uniref:Uncharacterized protein n=1 Tax=Kuenenia stuttgartiensis TaxID=174633 RepID=Q1PXX9_KUEST|nr:hypothetical protein KsCSTR_03380 [Candidatus Kuenenia stuttgartiensis]CAJ72894.1 unknown protein [Candidatus Kuenenia stuttgartiensis]